MIIKILDATWHNVLEASPWLIFGFIIAGLIHSFMPLVWINFVLRKKGISSIINASLIGAPLPLCSCSIIPVVRSLRQKGVPRGAAASFMTSTPEIGIGSFLLTYGLLGPVFALIRVVASVISAIIVGIMVDSIKDEPVPESVTNLKEDEGHSCCSSPSHDLIDETPDETIPDRLKDAFIFSFYTLPKDLTYVLSIGFIIAGVFAVALPPEFLTKTISSPLLQILLSLIISLPMYVCATSSTPIAAVLFYQGLGVGAVLVFLLAGAATNVSTILAAKKEFGVRGAVYYVGGIVVVSLIVGLFFQYFVPLEDLRLNGPVRGGHHAHKHGEPWLEQLAAVFLVGLLFFPPVYDFIFKRGQVKSCCKH
ncbi:MAG TPA: SO_0444 family Cu/Zn efflux transporter [Oligoflexia bacterium]|nr:SO_0444 family Cu/Zn efflux transporter [Oligoflexia bacterium]HMP47866.1 SO_0444 family Cu/Zn efflux transporter [Oligoflexia bacterium]